MKIVATYVSVWDDGIEVKSDCIYDTETKQIEEIEMVDISGVDILIEEYVELPDGYKISVDHEEIY
jgi:hypothetical protein